jgi:hypothetical protein
MIHLIDSQPSLKAAAKQIARVIRSKAHNGHYRDRLHYVAANEDGSYAIALEGTTGADWLARNPKLMVGSYFTTRDEDALAGRLYEDLTA